MGVVIPSSFRRKLRKKEAPLVKAILTCVDRLIEDPRHPGLHTHRVQGHKGVWEAYVDKANRVTFHYEGGDLVLRTHCNHDILKHP